MQQQEVNTVTKLIEVELRVDKRIKARHEACAHHHYDCINLIVQTRKQ